MKGRIEILGVPVDSVAIADVVSVAHGWVAGERCKLLLTPNSEMCVEAQRSPAFMAALRSGDMNVPDTVGLWYAGVALHRRSIHRTPGADVTIELCEEASRSGWRVYLLGAGAGVGLAAATELLRRYPSLLVAADPGPFTVAADGSSDDTAAALERIQSYSPQLLFVALGAPKQELWLTQNRDALTDVGVRLAAGIGGSLDYLAGTMRRPPGLVRALGLEWLGRLVQQPRRIKRIYRAVVAFPMLVVLALLSGPRHTS